MKKQKIYKKGFTLVELIVVISILAVLVGLLAPNLYRYLTKSKKSNCIASLESIADDYDTLVLTEYKGIVGSKEKAGKILEEVLKQHNLKYESYNQFIAQCGNKCSVSYSSDYSFVSNIVCPVHGHIRQLVGLVGELSIDELNKAIRNVKDTKGYSQNLIDFNGVGSRTTTIDSTASLKRIDGSTSFVGQISAQISNLFESLNILSWHLDIKKPCEIYYSDQNINEYKLQKEGEKSNYYIRTMKYTADKKYYVGYTKIICKKQSDFKDLYNVLDNNNFQQLKAFDKKDYNDALVYYNKLDVTTEKIDK